MPLGPIDLFLLRAIDKGVDGTYGLMGKPPPPKHSIEELQGDTWLGALPTESSELVDMFQFRHPGERE